MKTVKNLVWPTWEELEAERAERWKNLPKKVKVRFIADWREFNLEAIRFNSKKRLVKLAKNLNVNLKKSHAKH